MKTLIKEYKREARHRRIRKKVVGTTGRPRLYVHRSLKNMYVQVIDDTTGTVLFGLSTLNKEVSGKIKSGCNIEAAVILGKALGEGVKGKGIKKVSFDRGGYAYHGRVKALAEAAREAGLEF